MHFCNEILVIKLCMCKETLQVISEVQDCAKWFRWFKEGVINQICSILIYEVQVSIEAFFCNPTPWSRQAEGSLQYIKYDKNEENNDFLSKFSTHVLDIILLFVDIADNSKELRVNKETNTVA